MPAPRRKPLLAWEPLPYLVLFVLLLGTAFIRPSSPPWLLWSFMAVIAANLVWLVVAIARERRVRNPDQWGSLSSVVDLEIVDAEPVAQSVRTVVPVADTHRHQTSIDLARVHGGAAVRAVLVPRASRWLALRYRVGVQLVAPGDKPRHAGFLRDDAGARWVDLLDGYRERGEYVRVPAFITGAARPFGVELDVSGLERLEAAGASGGASAA